VLPCPAIVQRQQVAHADAQLGKETRQRSAPFFKPRAPRRLRFLRCAADATLLHVLPFPADMIHVLRPPSAHIEEH